MLRFWNMIVQDRDIHHLPRQLTENCGNDAIESFQVYMYIYIHNPWLVKDTQLQAQTHVESSHQSYVQELLGDDYIHESLEAGGDNIVDISDLSIPAFPKPIIKLQGFV